jgi:hypothetical protein
MKVIQTFSLRSSRAMNFGVMGMTVRLRANNNNNNNYYLLQLGCHPVAVVFFNTNTKHEFRLLLNLRREGYMRSMEDAQFTET